MHAHSGCLLIIIKRNDLNKIWRNIPSFYLCDGLPHNRSTDFDIFEWNCRKCQSMSELRKFETADIGDDKLILLEASLTKLCELSQVSCKERTRRTSFLKVRLSEIVKKIAWRSIYPRLYLRLFSISACRDIRKRRCRCWKESNSR